MVHSVPEDEDLLLLHVFNNIDPAKCDLQAMQAILAQDASDFLKIQNLVVVNNNNNPNNNNNNKSSKFNENNNNGLKLGLKVAACLVQLIGPQTQLTVQHRDHMLQCSFYLYRTLKGHREKRHPPPVFPGFPGNGGSLQIKLQSSGCITSFASFEGFQNFMQSQNIQALVPRNSMTRHYRGPGSSE